MRFSLKYSLMGAALLAALALSYLKTTHIVYAEHQRFDEDLDKFLGVDALLSQDILKARFHLLEDYDVFPKEITESKRLLGDLAVGIPSFVSSGGREAIQQKIRALSQLMTQKEDLLERFKSQNAVLNNSLRYLPMAGTDLIKQVSTDEQFRELEVLLNELMRQVLVFSLHPSDDQTPDIRLSLKKLDHWRSQHGGYAQDTALVSLSAHMNSIVSHKPSIEALTQQIISLPTLQSAEGLFHLYNDEFAGALRSADIYRFALYVLCGLLLIGIGYTIYALKLANRSLEGRVNERTGELSHKNKELEGEIAERQRSEQELDRIFTLSLDMLCILGFDGQFKRFNPACERILGWSSEELQARPYITLVHPDDVKRTVAEVTKVATGGDTVLFEIRILCKDGSYRWVLWNSTPIHGTQQFYAAGRDITERKKSEEALRAGEERFRQLAETINDVFWMTTADMKEVLYVSPAYETLWGRSLTSLQENPREWIEAIHPDDRARVAEAFGGLTLSESSITVEYRVVRPDRSIRWVSDRGYQVRNDAGEVYRTAGIVSDITERKRLEKHLNVQSATRLALAESSSLEQVTPRLLQIVCETLDWDLGELWSVDRQAGVLRCAEIWNSSHIDVGEFISESRRMTLARDVGLPGRVWESGEPVWVNDVINDGNFPRAFLAGKSGLHGAFAFPILAGHEVLHIIGFFSREILPPDKDLLRIFGNISGQISEFITRSRLEQQLIQSQKMETVGRLAGGIAHEFNSIMTAIIGQSEMLLSDLPPKDPLSKSASEIRDAADRAAVLTRQLLAYGRKQILRPETLDLNRVIAGMDGVFRHLMGVDVDIRIVPGTDLKGVDADASQLEQVILNIVINARDAMPHGGKLTLETSNVTLDDESVGRDPEMKAGDYVMLAITDTGAGMSAAVKARIFEPFFSTKGVGQGTGLGLATCHGILKQSGGHITAYSELGKGTTFKIYLPQVQIESLTSQQGSAPAELPRGNETILLVEDDPALRRMASSLLGRLGYSVLTAADGAEALDLAERRGKEPIDLLFTDVVMPQLGGEELSNRFVESYPATRILFASAYTENAILHQGTLIAGVSLLQKPFTPAQLAIKVRELLDQ